jgi:CRP-like cAMP-binding protein
MNINHLSQAISSHNAADGFKPRLGEEQWRQFAAYLTHREVRAGDLLARQGDTAQAMVLLESGALQVFPNPGSGACRPVGLLRAGAVFGETGLFDESPNLANVEAMTPASVWELRGIRFKEMTLRHPSLAAEVLRAAGAVLAARFRVQVDRAPARVN